MPKKDIAELLLPRAQLTAHALAKATGPPPRGWQDYTSKEKLIVKAFSSGDDGFNIDYCRNRDHRQMITFYHVSPLDTIRNEDIQIIKAGSSEIIDGASIPLPNYEGFLPMRVIYTPDFRESRRENDVMMIGFSQSVETALEFSQGSDAAQFKARQSILLKAESRQDKTAEKEKSKEKGRTTEFPAEVPEGVDGKFWCTMKIQPKVIKTTGRCDVDFSIAIGTRRTGKGGRIISKWEAHHGKYKRHVFYTSWWKDCLPLIKAEGGQRNWDCWQYFRDHTAPKWLTDKMEAPLDLPFDHTSPPFDGWVEIEPHKEIIRVNPAINPEVFEKWQKSLAQS